MYQQQREALANGNIRGWLESMRPDEWADIEIMRPNGERVTLTAARVGRTQVGLTPVPSAGQSVDIMVHTHDTEQDAVECFRHNVMSARADAARVNQVSSMAPGPEQSVAAARLLAEFVSQEGEPVPPPGMYL